MKRILSLFFCGISGIAGAQGVVFTRDLSPAEGLTRPQEKPYRQEICLNGSWDFQPVPIPADWAPNRGMPPELTAPLADKWESTRIKIPSPWNVNEWGSGSKVGAGTGLPYAPSSLYYPSYPHSWGSVRMGWLRRSFTVPAQWKGKRLVLHFEAVMGEFSVWVNGKRVAGHFGDYLPFEVDVTDYVRLNKDNELLVGIRHRRLFDKTNPSYKYFRSTYPPGSNTDNLVGIWQDVYLLAVPPVRVTQVFVKPWVDRDSLVFDAELVNQTGEAQTVTLGGTVRQWINKAGSDVLSAPEINWTLGNEDLIRLEETRVTLAPGETKALTLRTKVQGRLKYWTPATPNLYTALLRIDGHGQAYDRKSVRFGWRQLTIKGSRFYLNGLPVQCLADIQHPFGAYICSRRFAWAWFKMIKDFGGNTVRLHAQPWPSLYLDLADEMGLMVLDEAALFGSSLSLNFSEDSTWARTARHIDALVLRDRNHPSVIGWSAGNELFAISLYNKPAPAVAREWEEKCVALARRPALLDPTRPFITDDGDEDMHGNLPVWSKHFSHGLTLDRLPPNPDKPLVVGESGATYYGKPAQLVPFAGSKPYESYDGRSEALAVDVYQNVTKMAKPFLAYYSPSELCWFGIEHQNLGYHDYSRLPDQRDGIFAGKPYEEGKPGYQLEHIPPYVTTFNPGLDPDLPVYKPLPMFEAIRDAVAGKPDRWDHLPDTTAPQTPPLPKATYTRALLVGGTHGPLAAFLLALGLRLDDRPDSASLVIIDGDNVTAKDIRTCQPVLDRVKHNGGLVWIFYSGNAAPSGAVNDLLPVPVTLAPYRTTDLAPNTDEPTGKYLDIRDGYFSEADGDRYILKQALEGSLLEHGSVVLKAGEIDWNLFLSAPENRKCAQAVLYEHLEKPRNAALLALPMDKASLYVSTLDYTLSSPTAPAFWQKLCAAMGIGLTGKTDARDSKGKKTHDLLMDGPVN